MQKMNSKLDKGKTIIPPLHVDISHMQYTQQDITVLNITSCL